MSEASLHDVTFGDPEYDEWYLKHRWENFDRPEYAQERADLLEELLGLSPGDRILDAGCGIGIYTVDLAKRGYDVVGMDVSRTFLDEAERAQQEAHTTATFVQGDYNAMSFEEEFSVAFIISAFFYSDKKALISLLKRLRRALQPRGRLLLDHPNPPVRKARYPLTNMTDEGNGVCTMSRVEYDEQEQMSNLLWLKLDINGRNIRRSVGRMKSLDVSEFTSCIHDAGFALQGLYKKREAGSFDPKTDDGFFLVAEKKE